MYVKHIPFHGAAVKCPKRGLNNLKNIWMKKVTVSTLKNTVDSYGSLYINMISKHNYHL